MTNPTHHINQMQFTNALRNAWQLFEMQNIDQAETIATQLLQVKSTSPEALQLMGAIKLRDGDVDQAILLFTKGLRYAKTDFVMHANLGLAYHEQGNLVLAEKHYLASLKINPDYVQALFNYHAIKINVKTVKSAINLLKQVVEKAPHDLEGQFALALLLDHYALEDSTDALDGMAKENDVIKARVEAYQYLKKHKTSDLVLTGCMKDTFELAMNAANQEGMVLEFGVRHANSIKQIAKLTKGMAVDGFDSFEGIPEAWHDESAGSYTTKGKIPKVPKNVKLHVGWFDDSLPKFLETREENVRLINVDCDIYSSTKTLLRCLAPRVVVGTVMVFDEFIGNLRWQEDEFKAFNEAATEYGWTFEYLAFSFFTKQVVLRITAVQ